MVEIPVVIHVPHSSCLIPEEVRNGILLSDAELNYELLQMTDKYVDELFRKSSNYGTVIRNEYSRLVVDPERFMDDSKEIMSSVGMGAVYTRTHHQRLLRNLNDRQREDLLVKYFIPYHAAITKVVDTYLCFNQKCLIIRHAFLSVKTFALRTKQRQKQTGCLPRN